ncbi:sensor histidine kinase [Pseudoflavonifractor phocaeensis]|uniref:sensor histidine kinase n=1 Tax=Pseudoflavonifractor phocaeensis TaxID=1870988 RepID=UPI00195B91EA|nr:HAMP domain-containing sensor histidine kinase [Pseudoflavonifractor phocaeensis]MBM6926707.1 HAMP domain-containing histidine kinase [Pseudoflavonifractor phocaeensis]
MTGYVIAGAAVLLALAVVVYDRWRTARTMRRLDDMLTAAIDGSFSEKTFDESRLSALESRLVRYLAASALSERNIREQKDQISALISDISHQTKTPVANLQLYAQLLSEQPLTPQGKDCAAAISAQADKLQTLIEALVKTSRLETGILALHPQPGEIAPVVECSTAQYAPKAAEKGIMLTVRQTEGSAVLDPKWTEEAVCNLLDNAIKYTPSGGTVTVEVKNYELFSAIRVSDTGPGIPEGEQAKIFGRFYRAPGAYQAEGVGIGLYLTRQIAEKQGGYVKVESAAEKGSTFSLFLPRP